MAGHSKWAQIKRKKAVTDKAKGATFARMAREVIVAARTGGGDPAGNFRLRTAIDRAKAAGLPAENIARAIKKGTGDDTMDAFEYITYEGYGAGGVAVMVETMTDNRNRTAADVREAFKKSGGEIGTAGCVSYLFKAEGHVTVSNQDGRYGEDDLLLAAADAGAEDIRSEEGDLLVVCPPEAVDAVQKALSLAGFLVASAEEVRVPLTTVEVTDRDVAKRVLKLMDMLDDADDVQSVTANFEIAESLLAELSPV